MVDHRPTSPKRKALPVGRWNYLAGDAPLIAQLVSELTERLPYTQAQVLGTSTLVYAGDPVTIGEIGLGFDADTAGSIRASGLQTVPRPVSYAWPEDRLIDLSIAQAAVFGNLVAFDGNMILGHEMHLDATLNAMRRERLSLVYFAQSRHQKGDWFVAKRRAPHVVLAHRLTPDEMIPLDYHAAAHYWAYLARERGIRFCYINFFKVLHATAPLECLHYLEHIKESLEQGGFEVTADVALPTPVPEPTKREKAWVGLTAAGVAGASAAKVLNLPDAIGVPLTIAAAGGAAALPFLEKPRNELEEAYPPSYAPKLLALVSSLAPLLSSSAYDTADFLTTTVLQGAAAASMATLTGGQDHHLRIEEYRGFNLDWAAPAAGAAVTIPNTAMRAVALSAIAAAWYWANRQNNDVLSTADPAHAEGHTHHLSAAARMMGDARIALGVQPARKWFGVGAVGVALSIAFRQAGYQNAAAIATMIGAVGNMLGLVGFRKSERALKVTLREAAPSYAIGSLLGLTILLVSQVVQRNESGD